MLKPLPPPDPEMPVDRPSERDASGPVAVPIPDTECLEQALGIRVVGGRAPYRGLTPADMREIDALRPFDLPATHRARRDWMAARLARRVHWRALIRGFRRYLAAFAGEEASCER